MSENGNLIMASDRDATGETQLSDLDQPDLLDTISPSTLARINRIVSGELRYRRATEEDIEDVCSDCVVLLLAHLTNARADAEESGVLNYDGYVATIARRACSAWSRKRYPAFFRLRIRLRYLLDNNDRFSLWQTSSGEWVCGLAEWQRTAPRILDFECRDLFETLGRASNSRDVVEAIFRRAGSPLLFNNLARVCAHLWAIDDVPQTLESVEVASTQEAVAEGSTEMRYRLARLWGELKLLPARQCAALLLNLRDSEGEGAAGLFVVTGTATIRELASTIEMLPEAFAEIWTKLPLNDLEIAERMKITRQQVINLRKCARERLRRRLGPAL